MKTTDCAHAAELLLQARATRQRLEALPESVRLDFVRTLRETIRAVPRHCVTSPEGPCASPADVVPSTDPTTATLALVSCHPIRSASHRMVVRAELDPARSSTLFPATTSAGSDEPQVLPGDEKAQDKAPEKAKT